MALQQREVTTKCGRQEIDTFSTNPPHTNALLSHPSHTSHTIYLAYGLKGQGLIQFTE